MRLFFIFIGIYILRIFVFPDIPLIDSLKSWIMLMVAISLITGEIGISFD